MTRVLVFTAMLAGVAVRGVAQDALPLTLEEAISRGLATSHRLAEAAALGDAAQAVVEERQAAKRPLLAAQGGYTRTNHITPFGIVMPLNRVQIIYPDVPDNYRTRL